MRREHDAPKSFDEIRGCRNRLAKAVRVNSHILNKELDLN